MTLLELAERCEQATGPDRTLDGAIWLAVLADEKAERAYAEGLKISKQEAAFRLDYMSDGARFTASLDAAMTLVPEGHVLAVTNCDTDGREPDFSKASAVVGVAKDTAIEPVVAATPALALCAAALKARAHA